MNLSKVLYTAKVTAKGGREGDAVSSDGHLKVKLGIPKEMGGEGGDYTNPEQLFAAAYAACYLSSLKHVANKRKLNISQDPSVMAEVGFGPVGQGFGLGIKLNVNLPGMEQAEAQNLADLAHQVCPYSNATRNNVDVELVVKV